jgi:translation initiation factor IF-1
MPKGDHIEVEGEVVDARGGGKYLVKLDGVEKPISVGLCGKMKQHRIRVVPGDRVKVNLSPYDMTSGFITYRIRY